MRCLASSLAAVSWLAACCSAVRRSTVKHPRTLMRSRALASPDVRVSNEFKTGMIEHTTQHPVGIGSPANQTGGSPRMSREAVTVGDEILPLRMAGKLAGLSTPLGPRGAAPRADSRSNWFLQLRDLPIYQPRGFWCTCPPTRRTGTNQASRLARLVTHPVREPLPRNTRSSAVTLRAVRPSETSQALCALC